MGEKLIIYNTEIEIPEVPSDISEIEDWGTTDPEEQYWRRKPLPTIFKNLDYDIDGNIILSLEQRKFCLRELEKIRNGCWVMINGTPTWLPYNYYYYLQYWTLENKKAPEYREVSRRYAVYRWHWRKVYWCLGILRGKGRRTGATSEITSNIMCEVTTNKNRRAGIISKTGKDSRKIFLYRVQFGFRHLPFFLQPTLENDKDSKTELVFNVPIKKTKNNKQVSLIDEVEGINSMIDYQAPGLNTYDQERLTDLLLDEGGKLETDIPFSEFLSIISECLVEGGEKVGFAEMPSTVNKWSKGGEQFSKAWDSATWKKNEDDEDNEETANKFVRYYCASYDGLPGFIGKFGESIIDAPTGKQSEFLISKYGQEKYDKRYKLGAKKFLELRRSKLTGEALEEEIRKYSFNETEMFMSANVDCIFNIINLTNQIEYLKEHPVYKRKIIYYRDLYTQKVMWRDAQKQEENFCWEWIGDLNLHGQENKCYFDGQLRKPGREDIGVIGVDGISSEQGGKKYGSKACAWAFIKYDLKDPENTGLFTGKLYGRPQEKDDLHEQVMLCAEYHGFIVYWEFVSDDYYGFFKKRGRLGYLARFPLNAIAPDKRKKEHLERHHGYPTTDFAISKGHDAMITYVLHYHRKIYWIELCEDLKQYDQNKRTPSDMSVSAMITLVGSLEPIRKPPPKTVPLVTVYPRGYVSPN